MDCATVNKTKVQKTLSKHGRPTRHCLEHVTNSLAPVCELARHEGIIASTGVYKNQERKQITKVILSSLFEASKPISGARVIGNESKCRRLVLSDK